MAIITAKFESYEILFKYLWRFQKFCLQHQSCSYLFHISHISFQISNPIHLFTSLTPIAPPLPQQLRLSNFASIPTVSQALESIKYWIVVIIISSSIILFLLFELDFFFYLKIYQNLISEYLKICFLKCSTYGAYIKSEYVNIFFPSVFFSFLFLFYLYTVVLIGLNGNFSRKEYFYEGLTPFVFEPQ